MPTRTPTTSHSSSKEEKTKKHVVSPTAQKAATTNALSTVDLQQVTADPRTARPAEILAIQRKCGNQAVTHLIQAKLQVGPAYDPYEQEADRVASQVLSAPEHVSTIQRFAENEEEIQAKPLAATITPLMQRASENEDELQAKSMPEGRAFLPDAGFESHLAATRGNGSPLPQSMRDFMEPRFGTDFSDVRLHTGSEAIQLNREISAQAFTLGKDIYLGEGKEDTESSAGKQLLAHELTHVVQQAGAVQRIPQPKESLPQSPATAILSSAASHHALYAKSNRSTTSFGRLPAISVIQREPVAVAGGKFDTIENYYKSTDGDESKGAEIRLRFDPYDSVGDEGDTISLVQTVKDTTRRWDSGRDVTLTPTTSQLSNRTLRADEPGVGEDDTSTGIDQEVLKGGNIHNIDPRYTEQRMSPDTPLETGTSELKKANVASVRSAKKGQREAGKWTHAALNDEPNIGLRIKGQRGRKATVTGGMKFEVAALHNEQNTFLGSVKWGWKMADAHAVLDPACLTLANPGSASLRFFKAATKWNRTDIIDPHGGPAVPTMKIPIPPLQSAAIQMGTALGAYRTARLAYQTMLTSSRRAGLEGLSAAVVQYRQAAAERLTALRDVWNGLADEARRNAAGEIINLLDDFLVTIQGRRPAQDNMWLELGFTRPPH